MDKSKYLQPREYEMMAVLLPDQGEEETTAAIDAVLGYITEQNGTIDSVNADSPWGRRRLAYTVRHEGVDYRDGHYVLVYFTAMPAVITEIERELKLDTNVIRYLLLIHDPEMGEKIDESQLAEEDEEAGAVTEAEDVPAVEEEAEEVAEAEAETEDVAEDAPADVEEEVEEVPAETEEEVEEAQVEEEDVPEAEAEEETEVEEAEADTEESDEK